MSKMLLPDNHHMPGLQEIQEMMIGAEGYALEIDLKKDIKNQHPTLPISRWGYQQNMYRYYWYHYTGQVFNERSEDEVDASGNPALLMPLRINLFKHICNKHAYMLWGEAQDGTDPYAKIKADPKRDIRLQSEIKKQKREKDKKQAKSENESNEDDYDLTPAEEELEERKIKAEEVEDLINTILVDSDMRSKQMEGGIVSQFLGGIVYKVYYDDREMEENFNTYPVGVEMILPDFFLPIWKTNDPFTLLEVFIVYKYTVREASELFPEMNFYNGADAGTANVVYIEHWTKDAIKITLDGQILKIRMDSGDLFQYDGTPGSNKFGVVPFVYIPHERLGFYGDSHISQTVGVIREFNARSADIGDAVGDSVHSDYIISNAANISKITLPNNIEAINLGNQPPGVSNAPELRRIDPPSIDKDLIYYPDKLYDIAYDMSFVPPVARGKDEGSQRSALTLEFRMWSMTSHIKAERTNWSIGMRRLAMIILRVCLSMKVGNITKEHLKQTRIDVAWEAMIPRDRDQQVNELVLMMAQNGVSPETAREILNLVRDNDGENEKVLSWIKKVSKASGGESNGIGSNDVKNAGTDGKVEDTGGGVVSTPTPGDSVNEKKKEN